MHTCIYGTRQSDSSRKWNVLNRKQLISHIQYQLSFDRTIYKFKLRNETCIAVIYQFVHICAYNALQTAPLCNCRLQLGKHTPLQSNPIHPQSIYNSYAHSPSRLLVGALLITYSLRVSQTRPINN